MTNKSTKVYQLSKRILLTGARSPCALELARHLAEAGHEVYAADTSSWHVARFSNSIKDFFIIPSPRYHEDDFIESLVEIVNREKIDLLIPVWEEVLYLSRHLDRFSGACEVFCSNFDLVHTLHNKWLFTKQLAALGMNAPRSELIRSKKDLENLAFSKPYILKACYSRAACHVVKVVDDQIPEITILPDNPWIAQEFLEGKKYCSYSVAHGGKLLAHSVYPVVYTLDGSSCLTFEAVDHPGILDWVKRFFEGVNYTGQAAFDFIEVPGKGLFAIECNPRATSGLHLFGREDHLSQAFLNQTSDPIIAKAGTSQQIAIGMLMYGWKTAINDKQFTGYLKTFLTTKDVIYNSKDLKPLLLQPLVLFSYWYKSLNQRLALPLLFTNDLDWNVEPKEQEKLLKEEHTHLR